MQHEEGATELERTRLQQIRRNTAVLDSIRAINDAELSAAAPAAAKFEDAPTKSKATEPAARAATPMSAAALEMTGCSSMSVPLTPSHFPATNASGIALSPGERAKLRAQGREQKEAPAKRSVEDNTQDTYQQSAMAWGRKHARTAQRGSLSTL